MKTFSRGQKSKLADLTPATTLQVGIDVAAAGNVSVDTSCFGVDAADKLSDDRYFIFYNQRTSPCGALSALGAQGGDKEVFQVDLSRLPSTIKKLVFVITIDGAGSMSQITRGHLRISAQGAEVLRFPFAGGDFGQEKAVMIGEIYMKDAWRFAAVGQGFNGGLSALLKHFGGQEIAAPPAKAPAPPAAAAPPAASPRPAPAAPSPPPKVNLGKVTLEKKGDRQAVDLRKGGGTQPIHVNFNWDNPHAGQKKGFFSRTPQAPDLDLGCMYRLADGDCSVIQPLGGNFGSKHGPPFIFLDKDDRSGAASDGENLYIYRPDLIDVVMVFGLIYEGAQDFGQVNARMTVRDQNGSEILMRLNNPDRDRTFCAVCTIRRSGNQVVITKEEQYFRNHPEADKYFGFGFEWTKGSK